MDNAMVRYRYASKRQFASRRRRRTPRQGGGRLRKLIVLQAMVCIVLLLIIMIARGVNVTATNFITGQVRYVLQHDIEFKSIISNAERIIADIRNKIVPDQALDALTEPGNTQTQVSDEALTGEPGTDKAETRDISDMWSENVFSEGDNPVNADTDDTDEDDAADAFPETSVLSANSENGALRISDMIEPVEGTLATPFGEIRDAILGNVKMHMGIDIDTKPGSYVKAVLDGEITGTGSLPEYGGYVEIQHYNGFRTVYANCYEIAVNKGVIVKRGDVIARTANSGISAGSHLHFEIWDGEYVMDPLEYISVPVK